MNSAAKQSQSLSLSVSDSESLLFYVLHIYNCGCSCKHASFPGYIRLIATEFHKLLIQVYILIDISLLSVHNIHIYYQVSPGMVLA